MVLIHQYYFLFIIRYKDRGDISINIDPMDTEIYYERKLKEATVCFYLISLCVNWILSYLILLKGFKWKTGKRSWWFKKFLRDCDGKYEVNFKYQFHKQFNFVFSD